MSIIGIEGGIGTGKTLTLVHLMLRDLHDGKRILSNVMLKGLGSMQKSFLPLDKTMLDNLFDDVKHGRLDLRNTTIGLQEMHNYMDSRGSMSLKNRLLSYWILQSRHTGAGSCDIMFDTQDFGQVDLRLRRNIDFIIRPSIAAWDGDAPRLVRIEGLKKEVRTFVRFRDVFDVSESIRHYDTHEVVDF